MSNNVIRSIAMMLIGLLLIFMSDGAITLLVRMVGAAFFLPALVSAINLYITRAESGMISKILISIIDVGCMAFGVWLLVAPLQFADVFVKLLAIVLLVFAVYQVIVIVSAQRYVPVPLQMYIAPFLLIVAAIVLLASKFGYSTVSVVFGVSAFVAGLSDMFIFLRFKSKALKGLGYSKGGTLQKTK